MARRFPACLALLAGSVAFATPVPKDPDVVFYYPTTPGAKWVYERPDRDDEVVTVSGVEKEKGELVVSRANPNGNEAGYRKVYVSAEGLRQPQGYDDDADPVWLLKARVKSGDSWDAGEGKRTVYGPDEVEVPAGKFRALRVVWERGTVTYTSWYAPNVGEIKRTAKHGDDPAATVRLLKSFQAK